MIQANEIIVGNWFKRELKGSRSLEYENLLITEEVLVDLFGENPNIALQDLFPVPITEDILKNCRQFMQLDPPKMEFTGGHLRICQAVDNSWVEPDLLSRWLEVPYVHTLQNLWRPLHQSELEINL